MPVIESTGEFERYDVPTNPVTGREYKGMQANILGSLNTCNQFAGFKQWLEAGRVVKKGQHGITIMMPLTGQDENGATKTKFMKRVVFAIEQTEVGIVDLFFST